MQLARRVVLQTIPITRTVLMKNVDRRKTVFRPGESVGQTLIALRELIRAGRAPGLRSEKELFTDDLGHPALPVQVLAAYGHSAVIYRRSPIGLPMPPGMVNAERPGWSDRLNRLFLAVAWEAALQHPLSGLAHGS